MADVATGIVGIVLEKLAPFVYEEVRSAWGVEHNLKELNDALTRIKEVLVDAESKQSKDIKVKHWLAKLKKFCYDAEEILDEFESDTLQRQAPHRGGIKRKVRSLFSCIYQIFFRFKIGHKIRNLRLRLKEIEAEKDKYGLANMAEDKSIIQRRETHSFVSVASVVGRGDDKRKMLELVMSMDNKGSGNVSVIPIVGIGGIGKTTLAKLIYMDDNVKRHFDLKVWIPMPVDFDVKKIAVDIVESIDTNIKCGDWRLEELQSYLRHKLGNKRCLFIFDDVWNVSRKEWVEFTELLEGVSKGSKIVITSRNQSVVSVIGATTRYDLSRLSHNDSVTLFRKSAFGPGEERNHPHLVEIGDEIVKKCGGNPLAVKTLGSLLYSKTDKSYWESIRDSEIWQLDTDILPSLRISYDLMPSYLKPCFAYCSIFPKNYEFNDAELIQLWIANGLIQPKVYGQELEDLGQQYWEELWSRSFFEDVREDYLYVTFKMHDLIHDLAQFVAQNESSVVKVNTQYIDPRTRHLAFADPTLLSDEILQNFHKFTGIRTIMFPMKKEGPTGESFLQSCISRFKHLRVLYLHESTFEELPSSIGNLQQLRFLHLCNNRKIKKLPKSVCNLQNLQSLGLAECEELEELPPGIKSMTNLRFLDITTKQKNLPENVIGCLTSLRCLVIADCSNLEALFSDMQFLTSLRKLCIGGCPRLTSLPRGILYLTSLEKLHIHNCGNLKLPEGEEHVQMRLKTLMLVGLQKMSALPMWLQGSARTLQSIHIENCPNFRALPEWLQGCTSLRRLRIEDCPKLLGLPEGMTQLTALKELKISNCGELSKRCEFGGGEDWSKIAHVPEIHIDGRKVKFTNS